MGLGWPLPAVSSSPCGSRDASPQEQMELPGIPPEGSLAVSYQSGLGWGRGCWGLWGLLWEKLECHTWGGAGGGGECRAGGLSCHIPPAGRELSWTPCPYLGRRCLLTRVFWDAIAGWLTGAGGGGGGGGGEPRRGEQVREAEHTQTQVTSRPRWEDQPWGRRITL